jgi:hypothetical protein
MRQEQQSLAAADNAADFRINFQMTNAGARHACSVTIRAVSKLEAATIFRENWLVIEKLARQRLAAQDAKEIRLETTLLPPLDPHDLSSPASEDAGVR